MVRADNSSNAAAGQAAVVVSATVFDKRALTATDPLALANTLLNVSYMASVSASRTGALLAADGGLELLHHRQPEPPALPADADPVAAPAAHAGAWLAPDPLGPDFRTEDLLLATQLIAYVSKYYEIRQLLHSAYDANVYALVERLTSAHVSPELRKWAVVCMRSCFKRNGDSKSLRRCSNLRCARVESHPHDFSKCSRCRRVAYCR
ncbi:hypothetical protein HK105_204510 [Polyrhizophydium stewartii]|uniref:Uncharacterized protein n=1 Tax=Polyrhizophydium stewartii TaxID=2732419 RepID=A0ABR4N990_9FUNG